MTLTTDTYLFDGFFVAMSEWLDNWMDGRFHTVSALDADIVIIFSVELHLLLRAASCSASWASAASSSGVFFLRPRRPSSAGS